MKVLELFAGSRSVGKAAEELGFETFSSDIHPFENIEYVVDIFDFDVTKVPFKPDIIWASPPCTTFSVASIGRYWNKDNTPKNEKAEFGIKIVERTLEIIGHFNPEYFFIENPMGKLRKLPVLSHIDRTMVCYCQYGDERMKPTDIWSNHLYSESNPRGFKAKTCFKGNRDCHHAPAPRGSSNGNQARKGAYNRSKIPHQLCLEVLKSCIK